MSQAGGSQQFRSHHPDYGLALIVLVLLALGTIVMYSISPVLSHKLVGLGAKYNPGYYFTNQLAYAAVGIVGWVIATSINFWRWRKYATAILIVGGIGLLALFVPGLAHSSNGATRWIKLGSAEIQPAEFFKLAVIVYLAAWFEKRGAEVKSFWDGVVPFSIMLFFAGVFLGVFQKDMGTTLVVVAIAVSMLYVAGVRLTHLAALSGTAVGLLWLSVLAFPHRLSRLTTFIHPSSDVTGQGYQINQALIGIGSGGILGLGLGHSVQVYGYLPEAPTDSIFAILAEEFGLIGSLAILFLFGLLVWRGLTIAKNAPDTFSRLIAAGISFWMLFQVLINVGAMISLLPLTGIPLPFISYGGSSLVASLFAMGILLNISKYTVREAHDADSRQRRGNGRAYSPGVGNLRRVKVAR